MRRLLLITVAAIAAGAIGRAPAQDANAQFFRGKQINLIVGSSAGGGYDIYARLLARHMSKYIPGNPVIVASNMPGAASNTAAAYIYNVAPKDGLVMATFATLFFVPVVFSILHRTVPMPEKSHSSSPTPPKGFIPAPANA